MTDIAALSAVATAIIAAVGIGLNMMGLVLAIGGLEGRKFERYLAVAGVALHVLEAVALSLVILPLVAR